MSESLKWEDVERMFGFDPVAAWDRDVVGSWRATPSSNHMPT